MSRVLHLGLASLVLLGGCASGPADVHEYLDQQTAITVKVVSAPAVYAHEAPELAANVRDYLSVGAVELNNMGAHRNYLALIAWSTIDRKRTGVPPAALPERIEIKLGGQDRQFEPATHEARSIGIGEPVLRPDLGYLGESWYEVTTADLRAFAAAPPESIELLGNELHLTYASWHREDAAFQKFVEEMANPVTTQKINR